MALIERAMPLGGGAGLNFKIIGNTIYPTPTGNNLAVPVFKSGTEINGLTVTINDDFSITVNGTATADTTIPFKIYTERMVVGERYVFNISNSSSDVSYWDFALYDNFTNLSVTSLGILGGSGSYDECEDTWFTEGCYLAAAPYFTSGTTYTDVTLYLVVEYVGTDSASFVYEAPTWKENTIWINTNTAIGEWQFSTTEPTTRTDGTALQNGDVWINVTNEGNVILNALKKNGIILYVTTAKQYINEVWTDVGMKTYQNGEWKKNTLYLYNEGNLCTDITGDWTGKRTGEGANNTSQSKKTDHLYLSVGSSNLNSVVAYHTTNKIDVTGYSKLCAKVVTSSSAAHSTFAIALASKYSDGLWEDGWLASKSVPSQKSYDGILEVDISSFSDKYYITLRSFKYSAWTGASNNTQVYKVWLE